MIPPPPPRRVSYVIPTPTAPPPLLALPPLSVPRRGETTPLFSFTGEYAVQSRHKYSQGDDAHPRHRLAVQALALDFSTPLSHPDGTDGEHETPGGILYTGGRDGLLCSWELGLPTKARRRPYGRGDLEDEEDLADSDDFDDVVAATSALELEGVEPRRPSKARAFSTSTAATGRLSLRNGQTNGDSPPIPHQDRWQIDEDALKRLSSPPKARFHQCIQSHTDWVNDIVLANYNRTLVSASSDSLVLAWNPHSQDHQEQLTPTPIGRHADYVRCLATGRDSTWVASGGFDRKIKLWDIGEGRPSSPLVELPSPPGSIYSLGTTPSGSLLAAGTPERVVRVWDPRSQKQVSRLGGHTDNIRAVLLAEDGKWLLSASSDSTVKLWSLAAQKCLHTFSHHASAAWSLFSQHPSLEVFYTGDRDGNLCKIDIEGTGDPAEGECIVLARDGPDDPSDRTGNEGITQMVAQDDCWVWAAAGGSGVKRWKDVPRKMNRSRAILRNARENGELAVPEDRAVESPVPLSTSPMAIAASPSPTPPSPTSLSSPERERPTPTVSFLEGLTSPLNRTSSSPTPRLSLTGQVVAPTHRPSSLRTPRQSLASATRPSFDQSLSTSSTTCCDIPYDSLVPLTLPEDTYFAPAFIRHYRDPDAATIYSTVSGISGGPHRPHLVAASSSSYRRAQSIVETTHDATNIAQRDYFDRESAAEAVPLRTSPDDMIEGGYGLIRSELLNDRQHALTQDADDEIALWDIIRGICVGIFPAKDLKDALAKRRPSDAGSTSALSVASSGGHGYDLLDYVRERIEGEVSIAPWCKCDTRIGSLTIHLDETRVFDAEAYIDECGVGPSDDFPPDHRLSLGKWVLRQLFDGFIEAEMALRAPTGAPPPSALFGNDAPLGDTTPTPSFIPLPSVTSPPTALPKGSRTPGMTIALATPATKRAVLPDLPPLAIPPTSPRNHGAELEPIPQSPFVQTPVPAGGRTPTLDRPEGDYFSLRPSVPPDSATSAPLASPTMSSRTSEPPTPNATSVPLPTPGGTLMGRLRFLGKNSKKASAQADSQPAAAPVLPPVVHDGRSLEEQQQQQILDTVFARPLAPCPFVEAPPTQYAPDMAIIISEETGDAWSVKYRGLVGTSYEDMGVLEQKAPLWLLDFLLGNRIPAKEPVKVSFILQPWKGEGYQSLPELPNNNARLTANRSLRVRKVCSYVADKLDLRRPSRAPSIMDGGAASAEPSAPQSPAPAVGFTLYGDVFNPEKEIEILVNGEVLPTNVTLATVRHCMWKSGGDVVFTYRSKKHSPDEE
ncbi:hypothetical protein JCM10049v2_000548 [Rhodotorula toruloides]